MLSAGNAEAGAVFDPPQAFLCPITQLLMEHPVTTATGNTFEYSAIAEWLTTHDTDPATNEVLPSKALSNALLVRGLIRDWAASNPHHAKAWRNDDATAPPKDLSGRSGSSTPASVRPKGDLTDVTRLGKVLTYKGTSTKPSKAQRRAATPPTVASKVSRCTYEFRRDAEGKLQVCIARSKFAPASEWVAVPNPRATTVFATPQGLVFFDPEEVHDVRAAANGEEECKFKGNCTNASCTHGHPFACQFGVKCKNHVAAAGTCKFLHPDPSSVVPLGDAYPLNQECKYSTACTNKGCHFAHSRGRVCRNVQRAQKFLFATHNPDLSLIAGGPVALDLGPAPPAATRFSFQGEFAFFYTPYPGAWAKEHFQTTTVHRFDGAKSLRYQKVGDYALNGHYCNAAVGSHQYFLLSWWPFEDEAMRAHWEAERQLRAQGKSLRSAEREVTQLRQEARERDAVLGSQNQAIFRLQAQTKRKDAQIVQQLETTQRAQRATEQRHQEALQVLQQRNVRIQVAVERKSAQIALQEEKTQRQQALRQERFRLREEEARRKQAERESRRALRQQREEAWRRQRQAAATSRAERFPLRDPIHVYALAGGKSGTKQSDWHLVVDYHKGAHGLELSAPFQTDMGRQGSTQRLKVTEGNVVFEFDLVVPEDLGTLGQLPIVPGRLCEGF